MKKKLMAWFLTGVMCFCRIIPFDCIVFAEDNSSVTVTAQISGSGASDLKPGDKFYVDVSVSSVSASVLALNAAWDTNTLELTDAAAGSSFYSGSSVPSVYVPFYKNGGSTVSEQALKDYENNIAGDVCVFAFASGDDLSCGGTAVTLEFTVKQDAENGLSNINVYFDPKNPPKHFGSGHEGVDIRIAGGNSSVSAEITGGQEINTGLVALTFGNSEGTLEPEFSQRIREYTFIVPPSESGIPKVEASLTLGTTAEIDQATDFDTDNTAVIRVNAKKTNIYKVHFVRQSRAAKPVIMPSIGEIERNTIISITSSSKGHIYYTVDGSDPDITDSSLIYGGYFTPESAGIPANAKSFTVKAVSVEDGLEPSEIAEATYKLPDNGAKATKITVNGTPINNFSPDTRYYMYQISYEEWKRGNNIYTIEAFPLESSADIEYIPGNMISFDCGENGEGDEKQVEIRIDTGDSFANYIIYFMVEKCKHTYLKENVTLPTCEEPGSYIMTCGTCGKLYYSETEDALGHLPGDPVINGAGCTSDGSITVFCQREDCGKELSKEMIHAFGHTPGEAVTKPATCGAEGSRIVSCTVCGTEISKEILSPTGNHEWIYNDDTQVCMICGATRNDSTPPAVDHVHVYNGTEYTMTEATCTSEGKRQINCSAANCGSYIIEVIPMLPHTEYVETIAPDCTRSGWTITRCSVCGTTVSEGVIDALGHSFVFEDVLPDCTDAVFLEAKCSVCGAEGVKTIEPVGYHDFNASDWKIDEDMHYHICSACGEKVDIYVHEEGEGVITREATESSEGVMTYYCSVCGYKLRTASIPMLPAGTQPPSNGNNSGNIFTDNSGTVTIESAENGRNPGFTYTDGNGVKHSVSPEEAGSVTLQVEKADNTLTGEGKDRFESEYHVQTTAVYDITLRYGNAEVQPDGRIKITIDVPTGTYGAAARIYRMEEDGSFTDMNAAYNSSTNTISFITEHLSIYVVAQMTDIQGGGYSGPVYKGGAADNSDGSDSGEDVSSGAGIFGIFSSGAAAEGAKMVLAIACISGIFVGFVFYKKKTKKDNGDKMNF